MKRASILMLTPMVLALAAPSNADAAPAYKKAGAPQAASTYNPLSIDKRKTRIFLPMRNVSVKKRAAKVDHWQLELTSNAMGPYALERSVPYGALHHLRIQTFEGKTYVRAGWKYAVPVSVNVLPEGVEIVFSHQKAAPNFSTMASGVRYWEGQRWTGAGPIRVRVLKLDPRQVRLAPAMADGGQNRMGMAPVSRIASWNKAIAAVNGSFFSPATGEPQGTLILNQMLLSRTMLDRPALWIKQNGSASIKVEKPTASVLLDDGTEIDCHGINETARRDRVTLYTDQFGPRTRSYPDPSRWELAVNSAGVVVGEGHGNIAIPKGGYVLSGQGKGYFSLKNAIGHGQELTLQFAFDPEVQHAIGGGPMLLHQGQVLPLPRSQRYQADIAHGRAPRTAVGLTRDGHYVLMTIDGRGANYSVGATLAELAYTMKELGAVEALNLDGGGSTTMWARGRVINKPSDGFERPVSTALLVLPRNGHQAFGPTSMLASGLKF